MDLKTEYGMKKLEANCPQCDSKSLFCGKIPTSIKSLRDKEVLFCKDCKFVISVDEYKKMLWHA